MCKIDSQWEAAVWAQGAQPGALCNLEGWDEGEGQGVAQEEGVYAYLWLIHTVVWQKPTQYCKAIIFQLKINF